MYPQPRPQPDTFQIHLTRRVLRDGVLCVILISFSLRAVRRLPGTWCDTTVLRLFTVVLDGAVFVGVISRVK